MKKVLVVVTLLLVCALLVTANIAYADGVFSCNADNPPQTAYVGGSDALYNATVVNLDTRDLYIVNSGCACDPGWASNAISVSFPNPFVRIAPGETWSGTMLKIHASYVPGGSIFQVGLGWGFAIQTSPGGPNPTNISQQDVLTIANAPSVPEPSSILAMICGIGGVSGMIMKKKSV